MKALYSIVGMRFQGAEQFVRDLRVGTTLTLIRDPENRHDPNAVQVWALGRHIGFVKATQAVGLAKRLDRLPGEKPARVSARFVVEARWPCAEVEE